MRVLMNETLSRRLSRRRGDHGLEIRKGLAKTFQRLSLIFSAIIKRMAQRELKNREAQRCEFGYEARKRKLLVALRDKISEKQTKIN
jgi:hypothetical protein